MITHISCEEKKMINDMVTNLINRLSKKMQVSKVTLREILSSTDVEIYQEYPYTTAVIRKRVGGRHIRGLGFLKYNLNDAKLGSKYAWSDTTGKIRALNKAYHSFIKALVAEHIIPTGVVRGRPKGLRIRAIVTAIPTKITTSVDSAVEVTH